MSTRAHEKLNQMRSSCGKRSLPFCVERLSIITTRAYMRIRRIMSVCSAPLQLTLVFTLDSMP